MTFASIINNILKLGEPLVFLLIGLSVVVFLIGIVKYMTQYGDENKRKESVQMMTYGLIGLFVMVSVWGLVSLFTDLIGERIGIPQIQV